MCLKLALGTTQTPEAGPAVKCVNHWFQPLQHLPWSLAAVSEEDAEDPQNRQSRTPTHTIVLTKGHITVIVVDLKGLSQQDIMPPCPRATGITKRQGNITPPKDHSKLQLTDPKEMEIHELPEKGLEIIFLKMLRELNYKRTPINNLTKIRKIILEQNEKFKKDIENVNKYQNRKFVSVEYNN